MSGRGEERSPGAARPAVEPPGASPLNLRIQVHRSLGTARFANVGFPPAAPAGSGVDVGEGLLEIQVSFRAGGTREPDQGAHLIGWPARAIRQLVPSTARIGEKEVDFWQKVNGFFRDRRVTKIIRFFAKKKKAKKLHSDGERKSHGASATPAVGGVFLRFPTAFPRQTTASPTEDRLLAKRRWLSGVSRLSPASGRPSSPRPTRRSACTSPR